MRAKIAGGSDLSAGGTFFREIQPPNRCAPDVSGRNHFFRVIRRQLIACGQASGGSRVGRGGGGQKTYLAGLTYKSLPRTDKKFTTTETKSPAQQNHKLDH